MIRLYSTKLFLLGFLLVPVFLYGQSNSINEAPVNKPPSETSINDEVTKLNEATLADLFKFPPGIAERKWEFIFFHHSATTSGNAKSFDQYHREHFRDPDGLEYHFVIDNGIGKGSKDGLIEVGGRWKRQILANHLFRPERAPNSLAICFVGNFDKSNTLTKNQFEWALKLTLKLAEKYSIPIDKIMKHCDVDGAPKFDGRPVSVCPGRFFPHRKFLDKIKESETKEVKKTK